MADLSGLAPLDQKVKEGHFEEDGQKEFIGDAAGQGVPTADGQQQSSEKGHLDLEKLAQKKVERENGQNAQDQEGEPQSETVLTPEAEGQSRQVTSEGKLQRTVVEMEDAVSSPSRLHLLEGGAVGGREIAKKVNPHKNRQAEDHQPGQDFLPVSLYARHQPVAQ